MLDTKNERCALTAFAGGQGSSFSCKSQVPKGAFFLQVI